MSPRARTALIIVILVLLLGGGGFAVWYFGFGQAGTALTAVRPDNYSITQPDGSPGVSSQKLNGGGPIPSTEVSCAIPGYAGGQEYAGHVPGDTFSIDYECSNHTDADITFDVQQYDYDIVAWQVPPVAQSNGCKDQDDVLSVPDWPDQYPYLDVLAIAQRSDYNPANADCAQLTQVPPPLNEGNQALTNVTSQKVTIPAGGTVPFTTSHVLSTCNYHQFDDYLAELDGSGNPTGRFVPAIGDIARVASGNSASCPNAPQPTGDLQIRIYEDLDGNSEYTDPPAGEGAVFAGHGYHVFVGGTKTEIDYATLCDNGDPVVGGAGRDTCRGLTPGTYDVDVDPDIDKPYDGPIKEPHNPNGVDPYTVTVTAGQTAIADFGYTQGIVTPGLGDLQIRIYEDLDGNSEYTDPPAGEGAPFAGHAYKVFKGGTRTEIDYATLCDGGDAIVGGAGRDTCRGLDPGTYDVDVNPDVTSPYVGPIQETHNPNGVDPYTVTVTAGQTATADFGYTKGIVTQSITCVVTANPTRGQKPLLVAFDGSASKPSTGQTITTWQWDFGDQSTGTVPNLPNVDHTYQTPGQFTTTLTVTDSAGKTKSCTVPISVLSGPIEAVFNLNVIAFNDKDEDGTQDPNNCSTTELGYNGATITVKDSAGTVVGTKDTAIGPQAGPVPCHGWAIFDKLPTDTYQVCIDEADRPELGSTGKTFLLQNMKRTVPSASCTTVTIPPTDPNQTATVLFGYNPRPVVQAFECSIQKTVSDTTPADEGTPDDPKKTNSQPGETLTYNISWTCTGFAPSFRFVITDTYDNLLTVVPGSITGGGVDNAAQHVITWNVPNSSGLQVASGNVTFKATIESPLAPGTYVLPNYVVMAGVDGQVIDQDQTETTVVVKPGTTVPDIEIVKLCKDVNGGTLLPGDVIECALVTWNNGNAPLTNVRVTDNLPPLVHGFTKALPPLPTGATDNSQLAPAGTNQTGFLDVSGFNLPNQGDTATITFRMTLDAGVPTGTIVSNLATATSGTVTDTDEDQLPVGGVVPTPPTPPAPGPTPGPTPPPLGPRVATPPPTTAPVPPTTTVTGSAAQNWVLIISALVAAAIATFVYSRLKLRPE